MTRFPPARRPFGLALLFLAFLATACGDGILPPGTVAGYYRLVSVNGQPLPYFSGPSLGLGVYVTRGDLVLRTNGTFAQGFGGTLSAGFVAEGTYRFSNREVTLRSDGTPAGGDVVGALSGDSLAITYPDYSGRQLTFTYRRARLGSSAVPSERYRLTSINGRTDEPLVVHDTTIGDTRYVSLVPFDSVTFSDGVFFRRHRSESTIAYVAGEISSIASEEWTRWGAYESSPGWIVLMHYSVPQSTSARDSLSIMGDTLVRRTSLVTGVLEERYTN